MSAQIFVITVNSQVHKDFLTNNMMSGVVSGSIKNYTAPVLYELSDQPGSYQTIVLTTTGTTNDPGCNPTPARY